MDNVFDGAGWGDRGLTAISGHRTGTLASLLSAVGTSDDKSIRN